MSNDWRLYQQLDRRRIGERRSRQRGRTLYLRFAKCLVPADAFGLPCPAAEML